MLVLRYTFYVVPFQRLSDLETLADSLRLPTLMLSKESLPSPSRCLIHKTVLNTACSKEIRPLFGGSELDPLAWTPDSQIHWYRETENSVWGAYCFWRFSHSVSVVFKFCHMFCDASIAFSDYTIVKPAQTFLPRSFFAVCYSLQGKVIQPFNKIQHDVSLLQRISSNSLFVATTQSYYRQTFLFVVRLNLLSSRFRWRLLGWQILTLLAWYSTSFRNTHPHLVENC